VGDVKIWFISGLETNYVIAKDVLSVCDDRKRDILIVNPGDTLDELASKMVGT
jgi:hypothetical protein